MIETSSQLWFESKNWEKKGQHIGNHADNNALTWMEYAENDVVQINSDLHPSDTEISKLYPQVTMASNHESWYVMVIHDWLVVSTPSEKY